MPELPDLIAYQEAITEKLQGHELQNIRIAQPFVVRSVDPPLASFFHRSLRNVALMGKRLVFAFDRERYLVLHLMIAGRLRWKDAASQEGTDPPALPGRIGVMALDFSPGSLILTEAGSKKRASLYGVEGSAGLESFQRSGIDIFNSSPEDFIRAMQSQRRTLKRAMTDPDVLSGVGNAYSDEILHAARLSPLKRTDQLQRQELLQLRETARKILQMWIERLRKQRSGAFPKKVTAFRPEMTAHGKFGAPCIFCGGAIQRIRYASNEANYCPACQTGGKLLADRALSRIMRDEWPKTLEELEAKKARST